MSRNIYRLGMAALAVLWLLSAYRCSPPGSAKRDLILATTTSTQDSGLLDVLIPQFEKQTGYRVKTVAVGTGEALEMGEQGNADVLLVHAPSSELEFMKTGAGTNRHLVMYNDFIIVGPQSDPANIKSAKDVMEAFKRIATNKSLFFSRGDDSGTNKKELEIWKQAGISPQGDWYQETGNSMGQTLQIASEKGGYTLTDRGTYLALRDQLDLSILFEGDPVLLNIYHVIQVNPDKFPKVNAEGAKAFVDFLLSPDTQKMIGNFGKDKYEQALFTPCANNSCGIESAADK